MSNYEPNIVKDWRYFLSLKNLTKNWYIYIIAITATLGCFFLKEKYDQKQKLDQEKQTKLQHEETLRLQHEEAATKLEAFFLIDNLKII